MSRADRRHKTRRIFVQRANDDTAMALSVVGILLVTSFGPEAIGLDHICLRSLRTMATQARPTCKVATAAARRCIAKFW